MEVLYFGFAPALLLLEVGKQKQTPCKTKRREGLLSGRLLSFELGDQGAFRKIYLCWRKDALLTPAEQKFLDFVQQRSLVTACE